MMVHQNILENFSEFPLALAVDQLIVEAVEQLWQYVLILCCIVKKKTLIQLAFQSTFQLRLTFETGLDIVMDIQWIFHLVFESPDLGIVKDIQLATTFRLVFLGDIHLETLVFDFFANRLDLLDLGWFFENH